MPVSVTPIYAAFLTVLYLALSTQVIRYRRKQRLSLGDHGDPILLQRMRAQGNCAEYAPIGILLILLAELQGTPAILLHAMGLMLLSGRVLHAYALSSTPQKLNFRVAGMGLTLLMLALSSIWLLLNCVI